MSNPIKPEQLADIQGINKAIYTITQSLEGTLNVVNQLNKALTGLPLGDSKNIKKFIEVENFKA